MCILSSSSEFKKRKRKKKQIPMKMRAGWIIKYTRLHALFGELKRMNRWTWKSHGYSKQASSFTASIFSTFTDGSCPLFEITNCYGLPNVYFKSLWSLLFNLQKQHKVKCFNILILIFYWTIVRYPSVVLGFKCFF